MELTLRRKKQVSLEKKWNTWGLIFVLPAVLFVAFIIVGPLFFNFWLSLNKWNPLAELSDAKWIGFKNYVYILTIDTKFKEALKISIFYAATRVIGSVSLGLILALLLNHRRLRGLKAWRIALFLPMATSKVVLSRIWYMIYDREYGILNTMLGVFDFQPVGWLTNPDFALPAIAIIGIYQSMGYNAILILAALQGIPDELIDAGLVDGATGPRMLWHIKLPLLKPVLAFVIVISTITGLQVFDLIWATTQGGPANATNSVVLHMYKNVFVNGRAGMGASMAFILFAFILAMSLIQLRLLRRQT